MKKKKRIRRFYKLLFIVLVIIAAVLLAIAFNKKSFKKIGYNKDEIAIIEKLTKDEQDVIMNHKYNKNIEGIINSGEYNKHKLDIYLTYMEKYPSVDYLKIVKLINNENFKEKAIDDYIPLLEKYDNVSGVILYVNEYKDKFELDQTTLNILGGKYFIKDYIDRYISYYKNHSDLDADEIITRINANLDHEFYTDSKPADLSKGMYTLVNKYNHLSSDYVPSDLVQVDRRFTHNNTKVVSIANDNFVKLAEAGEEAGVHFLATTCYRDYNFQSILYNNYVKNDGVKNADTYSARPGSSEHQLGYSLDLTNTSYVDFDNFVYTEEYKWLKDNAHKYGFILRYPEGKEYITGYIFEPWHIRYVGEDIATYIYENDITYEEYYAYFIR